MSGEGAGESSDAASVPPPDLPFMRRVIMLMYSLASERSLDEPFVKISMNASMASPSSPLL